MPHCPRAASLALFLALASTSLPTATAQTTQKASVDSGGATANASSLVRQNGRARTVSADGRYVVFSTSANNLEAGDLNGWSDIYLRDLVAATTTRISRTSSGQEPNGPCYDPTLSDDARFIAYTSEASNLAAGDFNSAPDVFVIDRQTGLTTIISVANSGAIGNGASSAPSMSADGLRIAFQSAATNLVPGDSNGKIDIFTRNLEFNVTRKLTSGIGGTDANADCVKPMFSGNGKWISFESDATNLIANDANPSTDVYVVSFVTSAIELVSVASNGSQPSGAAQDASISFDGNAIAFTSAATGLTSVTPTAADNVYLRNRSAATTTMVNALPNGTAGNASATQPQISAAGDRVLYLTAATNLGPGDTGTNPDAYITDVASLQHARASLPITTPPAEPNNGGIVNVGGLSGNGRFAVFTSAATNLIASDANDQIVDVFVRDAYHFWYRDADNDGFGDAGDVVSALFQPSGYVLLDTDCDDTNPAINPNAVELCNGIDDNCNNQIDETNWTAYCATSLSDNGCTPHLTAVGIPSASATSGFNLVISDVDGERTAAVMYSLTPASVAWAFGNTSTRCLAFPWVRVGYFGTGGTPGACDGTGQVDWLAFMAANPSAPGNPLVVGSAFYAQGWYRAPAAVKHSNLTDAVQFSLCP